MGPVFASKLRMGMNAELFVVVDSVKPTAVTVTFTNRAQLGAVGSSLTSAVSSWVFQ